MKTLKKLFVAFLILTLSTTQAGAFTDVPPSAWFWPYVNYLMESKIVDNVDKFNPSNFLNRAEFVKMVITALDGLKEYQEPAFPTFNDVPKDVWFSPFVEEAATRGIVNGYADAEGNFTGYFGPADVVTRGAAVKVLVRAFNLSATPQDINFSDVSAQDWYYNDLKIAVAVGMIEGYEDQTFRGNKAVTRAEMAKMLVLSMGGLPVPLPEEPLTPPETPETPEEPQTPEEEGIPAEPNLSVLENEVATGGEGEKFVARYNFMGNNEGFYVDTVTVVNDVTGNNLGDDAQSSIAIKKVYVKYPDKNGLLKTASANLQANGEARFSGLDFYVKREEDTFLEIYADLSSFAEAGANLSGKSFRLGLKNVGVDTDDFRAVGEFSNTVISLNNGGLINSGSDMPLFTMRKSRPSFEVTKTSDILLSGTQNLTSLNISAAEAGSLGLGRLVFNINVFDSDAANLTLSNFRLFAGSNLLNNVRIYDASGGQDLSVGTLTNGNSTVIVSFDQQEILSAGQNKTYHLKVDVSGVGQDDSINTQLASGDDDTALSGLTTTGEANTGKIFVDGDATAGIFTSAADFSETVGVNRNIIWSDFSAQPHQYATINAGVVTTDTGSADWTNGYQLGISELPTTFLSK